MGYSQEWKKYPYSPQGSVISFPADEGRHSEELIEWWYTAGHLIGRSSGTRYSFMLTYFYYPAFGYDGFRILNLGNDDTGQFYQETTAVNYNIMAEDSLNINATTFGGILEYWTNKTDMDDNKIPFEYILSAESAKGTIVLDYVSEKPPLIVGDDGYFNQGSQSYTYYFSLTKNNVTGTLTIDGVTENVTGTAWIDRQYGSFNPLTEENYEWFYIQLSNDMDLNIYNLFTRDRQLPDTATYKHMSVYVDTITQYTTHNFEIERLSFYCMPDSVMCYSQKWRLTSSQNNIDLIIETLHNNSEVQLPFRFFEGPTRVSGTVNGFPVSGVGFAELLHSYEKPILAITYPSKESWTSARALSWDIENPDDGRPLLYDLEYSINEKETFNIITRGLQETFFYWTDPSILPGSGCWFRVTAYSKDSTLNNTVISTASSIFDPTLTAVDTRIKAVSITDMINIYPNPADEILFLDLKKDRAFKNYMIIDVFGRTIINEEITSNQRIQININFLSPGIYFLGLSSGSDISLSKFLVK
jgi:predicted secreted hydrolase